MQLHAGQKRRSREGKLEVSEPCEPLSIHHAMYGVIPLGPSHQALVSAYDATHECEDRDAQLGIVPEDDLHRILWGRASRVIS